MGEIYEMLDKEKQTWNLMGLLFKDRLETNSTPPDEPMMIDKLVREWSQVGPPSYQRFIFWSIAKRFTGCLVLKGQTLF